MTPLIGVIIGIGSSIIGILLWEFLGRRITDYFRKRRSRANLGDIVLPFLHWHISKFEQPLEYLEKAIELLAQPPVRSQRQNVVTEDDLRSWGTGLLLTAASMIDEHSQGKANLFVVSSTGRQGFIKDIRSKAFVGAFPIFQLIDIDLTYRDMPVPSTPEQFANPLAFAVAAQSLFQNDITIQSIETAQYVSTTEKKLGTTHILAIPLISNTSECKAGDEAVITVDLRFTRSRLFSIGDSGPSKDQENAIIQRASRIQAMARQLYQFK